MEGPGTKEKESVTTLEGDNWVLTPEMSSINEAEIAFAEKLKKVGWAEDEIDWLKLGFREALVNAVAHGNFGVAKEEGSEKGLAELMKEKLEDDPEKKNTRVRVALIIEENKIEITITDEGNGFDYKNVANPTAQNGLYKSTGRGIFLAKQFFDSVEHKEKGNVVTLIKEKGKK
jgi:serine/threonine-protein kinase RsbW